ncbi:hypothetical protein A7U60_g7512 [Sanghuangporus baumii]|uniref:Cryptic loci regulator 2 N-terminal domain-containing protein n=1 Tax=Sanghuangporus baumii TaxID=108892 RepID=A0A9Q5N056_SANBA|nr:hypothetical protein A7U60_g7512 [Sanghuangporus baumii]
MLNYPELESKSWVLKDWPEGYHFYDHNKGHLASGKVRHDLYLVGSRNVARFRSPAEFIPHAYWLMTNPAQDRSKCACKYCAGKPQREISDAMGLSQRQSESASLARYVELPRREKRRHALPAREGRVFATVRQVPNPIKLPKGPSQHVNPEREKDLRAILGPKTLGERRWAREGELVWVKLDHPVTLNERRLESEEITFWPGMIEEVNFKAEAIPRRTDVATSSNAFDQKDTTRSSNGEALDPWTIVHKSIYKIKLLVVLRTVVYGGDHIVPYQSHAPDGDLLSEVQSIVFDLDSGTSEEIGGIVLPSDSQVEETEQALFKRFQSFDPFPPVKPQVARMEDQKFYQETAAGAFATAIQIASHLAMYYTPFDEWEYKMKASADIFDFAHVGTTTAGLLTAAEEHALRQRHLGAQNGGIATQTRFQGLWWGPERIWMGDLVRLKLGRYEVAPEGTETIKKPSGAGRRTLSEVTQNGDIPRAGDADVQMEIQGGEDAARLGASSRSVFLRIDGLFVVQVPTEDGLGRENQVRMCGMLYELADDDWEPDGEEFGKDPTAPTENGTTNQERRISSDDTLTTPQAAIVLQNGEVALAGGINGSATVPPVASTSSSLFTPNPELLTEPAEQPDVVKVDVTGGPLSTSMPPSVQQSSSVTGFTAPAKPSGVATDGSVAPNVSLSGPLKSSESVYPTPPAPSSFKFRPILRDGHEVVMPLTTLAGRYYPGLLSNSLLQSRVRAAIEDLDSRESKAIRALEGLVPGVYNAVDAYIFLPRRGQMLREAEKAAWKDMVDYWRRYLSQRKNAIVIDDD